MKLLLLLGQSPFDITSGAAQSTRLIAETLAKAGFRVKALATTACEGSDVSHSAHENIQSIRSVKLHGQRALRFSDKRIEYELLEVPESQKHSWEKKIGPAYEQRFDHLIQSWKPDLLLTYGGDETDRLRRKKARDSSVKVIFALHNHYFISRIPKEVDSFLSPTEYLSEQYRAATKTPVKTLPPPLDPARITNPPYRPSLVTFVNPEPAKGSILAVQLCERLGRERPDQPFLVVGGRLPAEVFLQTAKDIGIDLSDHPNLYLLPPTSEVGTLWAETKILLMPSVVKEAAGRCALEAMYNGAVPLVSNQAGLAEIVGDSGYKLSVPESSKSPTPVTPEIIDDWWKTLIALLDNPKQFEATSEKAKQHAQRFTQTELSSQYEAWFHEAAEQVEQ